MQFIEDRPEGDPLGFLVTLTFFTVVALMVAYLRVYFCSGDFNVIVDCVIPDDILE